VHSTVVRKHSEGPGADGEPTIVDRILAGEIDMVVNTPSGRDARADGYEIRTAAVSLNRPVITTVQELAAAVQGIESMTRGDLSVRSLQEYAAAARPGGLSA
jgi:carbamoyl-phosphate synthase large subunit